MRSRDRECAHHHNKGRFRFVGEDVYLCCLFFFYKTGFYTKLITEASAVLEWIFQVVPRQTLQAQFIQKQFIAPLRQLPTTHNIPLPFPPSPLPIHRGQLLGTGPAGGPQNIGKRRITASFHTNNALAEEIHLECGDCTISAINNISWSFETCFGHFLSCSYTHWVTSP